MDYRHGQADCQDTYQHVKFYGQAVRIGFWLFASGTHFGILLSDCQNRPTGRTERRFSEKSQYFMMAEPCSDMIEKMLPEDFIKNTMKSVEDINKADTDAKKKKEKSDSKKATAKPTEKVPTGLPSKLDQEQMDKMFELLVKPEIKNNKKKQPKNRLQRKMNPPDTTVKKPTV